ncbi:MAG: Cyclic nucleotide-binding domain protein [Candidatus Roizmanbacteria bacterium GW2011_GWA2_37_7]|uniref:Cyclic nucleotide-binding domain protein n=1 Tax=Candidatus Roizmanbacteria bacterium GW2011_GWA2_37_7 TaxID=1618481 RepID=A0A0G0JJR9_9BACT|nr:MAG: Cyclic nucleotide-binding domain protein [Candidatus Roizmanbacteria bacterium GW2011_GWA2_37_7]
MNIDKTKEFEIFYRQFSVRKYKKGEILIRADDDPQGIFCLTKGYVRQFSISKTGIELTLQILKPITYFPLIWAINGAPNIYFYEALTAVEVGRAPKEQVVSFINDKPVIILELMSKLLGDYAETLSRIEHLVFSDAYRRVISVLLYIAKNFGVESSKGIIVNHRFTQQDIATLVGVTRETASIEIGKIEKKKLVKYIDHSMLFGNIKNLEFALTTNSSNT